MLIVDLTSLFGRMFGFGNSCVSFAEDFVGYIFSMVLKWDVHICSSWNFLKVFSKEFHWDVQGSSLGFLEYLRTMAGFAAVL